MTPTRPTAGNSPGSVVSGRPAPTGRPSSSAGNPVTRPSTPTTTRGEGRVPSVTTPRPVPRPAVTPSRDSLRGGTSAGSARSLSQRVRSVSTPTELDDARRKLGADRGAAASRPVDQSDLLDRYRGGKAASDATRGTRAAPIATGETTRGTTRGGLSERRETGATDSRRPTKPGVTDRGDVRGGTPLDGRAPVGAKPGVTRPDSRTDADMARPDAGGPKGRPVDARDGNSLGARTPFASDAKGAQDKYVKHLENARPGGGGRPLAPNVGRGPLGVGADSGRGPIGLDPNQTGRAPLRPDTLGGTTHVGNVWSNRGGFAYCNGPSWYFNNAYWNTWGNCYGSAWGSWLCSPFYVGGFWWHSYWLNGGTWGFGLGQSPWWGTNSWYNNHSAYWYGPYLPSAVSVVVYEDPNPEIIYVEVPVAEQVEEFPLDEFPLDEGEALRPDELVAAAPLPLGSDGVSEAPAFGAVVADGSETDASGTDSGLQRELNRASAYYLTQGDRAFREARFGDSVHFYAKAVEFAPESGILYLVLSDALFATGDYRYAAFALRQAMDKEPSLFENVVDKRDFYANPREFEEQLAMLERFVRDHVLDMDARLVLAANYLFGGRPSEAIELLENPFSEELRTSSEGALLLRVASDSVEQR